MSYTLNLAPHLMHEHEKEGETLDFIPRNSSDAWGVVWSEGSIDAVLPINEAEDLAAEMRRDDVHCVMVERFPNEEEATDHADSH